MYHATGNYDFEIEAYEIARQKDPTRVQPLAYVACAYKISGNDSQASLFCNQAIKLNPTMLWLEQYLQNTSMSSNTDCSLEQENYKGEFDISASFCFISSKTRKPSGMSVFARPC